MVVMFPRDSSSLVGMTLTLSDKNIVMHIQINMFKREHMPVYKWDSDLRVCSEDLWIEIHIKLNFDALSVFLLLFFLLFYLDKTH